MRLLKPSQDSRPSAVIPLRPGDIIGFSGSDLAGDIINIGSYGIPRWGLSHVAILAEHNQELLLFESTTFNEHPCEIRKVQFAGTQAQKPWVKIEGYKGRVWHYPLALPLRRYERDKLSRYLVSNIGIPYDMLGAVRSGGRLLSWFESRLHAENIASIFCSEWCAASMRWIERFDTDDVSKWNPNALVRECARRAIHLKPVRLK